MHNPNEVLEFAKVLQKVAAYALTTTAKNRLLSLTVSTDFYAIKETLSNTDEALRIVYSFGRCPIECVHEIKESLNRAAKGGTLSIEELYHISSQYDGIIKVKNFLDVLQIDKIDNFRYLVNSLQPVKELKREVERCISANFTIYDNATSTLAHIRKEIISKESEVRKKLEKYVKQHADLLSDSIITVRNERLVIPVKSAHKYAFGGIIHDQSDSGQTFYVEPEEIVTINSKLQILRHQEADEIDKILTYLTDIVRENSEDFLNNFDYLQEIDFLFAKGQYGKEIEAKVAEIVESQEIKLIKARHPLIEAKSVVANDFIIGGQTNKIVLITGPNTGGKTVALKTVGLLVMMNQAGLAIPVDFEARLGVFSDIFVDIGDEQSIEQSLSTFSSHLSKIINITNQVNEQSLVLIDELGGGTDPKEGEALAMAMLDYFHQKRATVLTTTHYSNLKTFAIDVGYICNASMMFDVELLKPTYRLVYGIPGKSYAFTISSRLGLNDNIVNKAKEYQKHFSTENDELVEKLQHSLEEADTLKLTLQTKVEQLNLQLAKAKLYEEQLKQEKLDLVEKSAERIEQLVENATQEIDTIISELKIRPSSEVKMHEWIAAKKRLEDVSILEVDDNPVASKDFEVGETVFVPQLNKIGKITRKRGEDYYLDIGSVSMKMKGQDLQKHAPVKEEPTVIIKAQAKTAALKLECNLIGLHVDEALTVLQKYLDDALLLHFHEVRIIHGYGSGALRKAVHAYLDKQSFVKSYRLGGAGEGGFGATVVSFKE